MKTLSESILRPNQDLCVVKKIKPELDPAKYVAYQYAWYQIMLDILQRAQEDGFRNMNDVVLTLMVYKQMLWNVRLMPSDDKDEYVIDEDDDIDDYYVDVVTDKFVYDYIDDIIKDARQVENGNTSKQYMFNHRSSGSILYGLFDDPEGLMGWFIENMVVNSPDIRKYKSFIIKQLKNCGIEI
jgi:hypothetical protein